MLRELGKKHYSAILATLLALFLGTELVQTVAPSLRGAAVAQDDAAEEAADAAPAAPAAPTAETPAKPPESMLMWTYNALGIRYTVAFLAVSFAFVALLIMNILSVRRDAFVPQHLVDNFEAQCNEKKYQEAYETAKADESFLGQMLSAGLARLQQGYPQAVEAMQEVGEEENMKLEHRLSYIAMIGTLAPMIGLLGTVDGMIASFQTIATSPTTPKPSELASGISTALVTTLVGLLIAIPAIAAFNILKNRIARLVLEVGIVGENLMSRFENVAPKK
jgi:biopolymer transport protein ExbB